MAVKKVMKKAVMKTASKPEVEKKSHSAEAKVEEAVSEVAMKEIDVKRIVVPDLDKEEIEKPVENADSISEADEEEKEDEAAIAAALENAAKNPKSKNEMNNRVTKQSAKKATRGVLYIGHLPPGFCENQIRKFFSQFGDVTAYRLCRSKKTGRSKGFGFVEFELKEVAEVVAQTMDKYLVFNRPLDVKFVPKEKVHPHLFKGGAKMMYRRRAANVKCAKEKQNNRVIKADDGSEKRIRTERQSMRATKGKKSNISNLLKDFGIDYDLTQIKQEEAAEQPKQKKQASAPTAATPPTPVGKKSMKKATTKKVQ